MPEIQLRSLVPPRRLIAGSEGEGKFLSDAQLLAAFVHHHDEMAVKELVWRHGQMVLNICRRILHDEHHAEDAFQVAFLALVRHARSIGKQQSISSWLFKVAYRAAQRQRARLAKEPEQQADFDHLVSSQSLEGLMWRELRPVLDEEINRLPEKYRGPIVLCYLQGHTTKEAAEALRCPQGTILSRLSRAREQLSSRLTRRGLALSAAGLGVHLSMNASSAALSAKLIDATAKTALAGNAPVKGVASLVAVPRPGVFQAICTATLKTAAVLCVAAVGLTGAGLAQWPLSDAVPIQQAGSDADVIAEPQTIGTSDESRQEWNTESMNSLSTIGNK